MIVGSLLAALQDFHVNLMRSTLYILMTDILERILSLRLCERYYDLQLEISVIG
jgi:hypothetical protein